MNDTFRWICRAVLAAGWAPALVFLAHLLAAGDMNAYGHFPELDIPMHFFGGVAIGFFFWRALAIGEAESMLGYLSEFGRSLFTLALVCSAAVGWEFLEWSSDAVGFSHAQGGLADTLLDMLLGIAGGGAFLVANRRLLDWRVAAWNEMGSPSLSAKPSLPKASVSRRRSP